MEEGIAGWVGEGERKGMEKGERGRRREWIDEGERRGCDVEEGGDR